MWIQSRVCTRNRSAHFLDGRLLASVVQERAIEVDQDSRRAAQFDLVAHEDQSGREHPELAREAFNWLTWRQRVPPNALASCRRSDWRVSPSAALVTPVCGLSLETLPLARK